MRKQKSRIFPSEWDHNTTFTALVTPQVTNPSLYTKQLANGPMNPFKPKIDLIDWTLSNARQFYSPKGDPLGVKQLKKLP